MSPADFCPVCSRQIQPGQAVLRIEAFTDENGSSYGFPQEPVFVHADHLIGLLIGARA